MEVTLNILLSAISQYNYKSYIMFSGKRKISRVRLYDGGENLCAGELYVCRLSAVLDIDRQSSEACFVCVRDRLEDEAETEQKLNGLIIVNANVPVVQLFTEISEMFLKIISWKMTMQSMLLKGCTLQELLSTSTDIIGNYIAVNDSAFRMIANTEDIPCDDDPICKAMKENARHPQHTIDNFRRTHRFDFWEKNDYYIETGHVYSQFTLVGRIFRVNDAYTAHAVMTCNRIEATPAILDLYDILCSYIARLVTQQWESKDKQIMIYDLLLNDIVEGKLTDAQEAYNRIRESSLTACVKFMLFRIPVNQIANYLVGRICQEICEIIAPGLVTLYMREIVFLVGFADDGITERRRSMESRLIQLISNYELMCGASSLFSSLNYGAIAYEQTQIAFKYGRRLANVTKTETNTECFGNCIFYYEDMLPYCLLSDSTDAVELWRRSKYGQMLNQLYLYDLKHDTDNLKLLKTYMQCERKARETGDAMHMHRNNVVYRLERIKTIIGDFDLEDANCRTMLNLSFLLINLYGFEEP